MATLPLRCDRCGTAVRGSALNQSALTPCPTCGARLRAWVFPAFFVPPQSGKAAPAVTSTEDASCFFHPRKKAMAACEQCGRFLCGLCEVEIDARKLCPSCLAARDEGRSALTGNEEVLYDRVAWSFGFLPLVTLFMLWPVFLITAGVTLYFVIRYWGAPRRALIPRSQTRMALAAVLAVVQLLTAAGLAWLTFSGILGKWLH